jgi:uncharacterized membrane protein YbaN (DUF454 family)
VVIAAHLAQAHHVSMIRYTTVLLWRCAALAALLLGLVGVVVPGLPTVPFLLLAAWCGGKGWPAMEAWLLRHPRYGDTIRHWREHRAIPLRAKQAATVMMAISALVVLITPTPVMLRWLLPPFLLCVCLWVWSRPHQ